MRTADDDSGPVSHEAFTLPRALLNWDIPSRRGVDWRAPGGELDPDRTEVSGRDPLGDWRTEARASRDELDDEPTIAIPVLPRPILLRARERPEAPQTSPAHGKGHWDAAFARAAQLWRDHPLRMAAIVAGAALITYFAVDGARQPSNRSSQMVMAPAVALRVTAPIVEQLSEARLSREIVAAPLHGKQLSTPGRRSGSRRARETPPAAGPASKHDGEQAIAPAQPQSRPVERSSTPASSSSAGLPAWGAEAVREFSSAKSSKATAEAAPSQALTTKPASSADVPPAVAAEPPAAREQSKPAAVVAAKPAEPPEPVAPPRPSGPLTMEQMLDQVEQAAQAQRKKAGLKAPKTSQHDAELDELINSAVTSKKK